MTATERLILRALRAILFRMNEETALSYGINERGEYVRLPDPDGPAALVEEITTAMEVTP